MSAMDQEYTVKVVDPGPELFALAEPKPDSECFPVTMVFLLWLEWAPTTATIERMAMFSFLSLVVCRWRY